MLEIWESFEGHLKEFFEGLELTVRVLLPNRLKILHELFKDGLLAVFQAILPSLKVSEQINNPLFGKSYLEA